MKINMVESKLFSVIIPAYHSSDVWKDAVDSVLMQDYPAIELIFCDDGTPDFDAGQVRGYIEAHKRDNLKRYCVVTREKNVGTVANVSMAHAMCTGSYMTDFAADDAYCAEDVLTRYARALEEAPADVMGVFARSVVCDEALKPLGRCSFDVELAKKMNDMDALGQFNEFAYYCCAHLGATAYKLETFRASGGFDPRFYLLEDWPFYVNSTLSGYRFQYVDFDALLYRAGGVTDAEFSSPVKQCALRDHFRLYEELILPNTKRFKLQDRVQVCKKYRTDRMICKRNGMQIDNTSVCKLYWKHKWMIADWILYTLYWHRRKIIVALAGLIPLLLLGKAGWAIIYATAVCLLVFGANAVRYLKKQK